jgi:hypothetical protein
MIDFMKIVEHLVRPHFHARQLSAGLNSSIFKKRNNRHCIFDMRLSISQKIIFLCSRVDELLA